MSTGPDPQYDPFLGRRRDDPEVKGAFSRISNIFDNLDDILSDVKSIVRRVKRGIDAMSDEQERPRRDH